MQTAHDSLHPDRGGRHPLRAPVGRETTPISQRSLGGIIVSQALRLWSQSTFYDSRLVREAGAATAQMQLARGNA